MLLTLDLASDVGWTCGDPADRQFMFGTMKLPRTGNDIGAFAVAYDKWLRKMIDSFRVAEVVFEMPVLPKLTALWTLRKLYGLTFHTEFVCTERSINCLEANLSSVKKYMSGTGWATKQQMVDSVRKHGFDVRTQDEADAVGVRLYHLSQNYPDCAHVLNLDLGLLGAAAAR